MGDLSNARADSRRVLGPPWWIIVALVLLCGISSPARAQDVSAQFPEATQVTADYPDDVERAVAFTVLYDTLLAISPKPMPRPAYDKDFGYQANSNAIATAKMANGGMQNGAYRQFNDRYNQLLIDQNFRHSVREKYHLTPLVAQWRGTQNQAPAQQMPTMPKQIPALPQIPAATQRLTAAPASPAPTYGQPGYQLPQAAPVRTYEGFGLADALPLALIPALFGLIPMYIATGFVSKRLGVGRKIRPVPASQRGGLPALPRGLEVVSLPGVRYSAYVLSGLVLDNRTSTTHQTSTFTSGGDIIQGAGGQIMTTPIQTSTYSKSTSHEAIFVRTPDFGETVWNLTESPFQSRPGNIISILVRPLADGTGDILVAYNHSTGALVKCSGLEDAHRVRAVEIPQWTANIVGGMWVAPLFAIVSPPFYGGHGLNAEYCLGWFILTFLLVTISFFITTPMAKNRIYKSRDGRFSSKYLPGYRQFFEQGSPVLQRAFMVR